MARAARRCTTLPGRRGRTAVSCCLTAAPRWGRDHQYLDMEATVCIYTDIYNVCIDIEALVCISM